MSEQDVSLRLRVKPDDDPGKPLKEIGRAARDAETAEDRLRRKVRERIDAYREAMVVREELAKLGIGAAEKELNAEQKYQKALKETISQLQLRKRMKKDLAEAGHGEGKGAGAGGHGVLGALGLGPVQGSLAMAGGLIYGGAHTLDRAAQAYQSSIDPETGFSQDRLQRSLIESFVPSGLANAMKATNQNYAGQRHVAEARHALELAERRAQLLEGKAGQARGLRGRGAGMAAEAEFGFSSAGERFGVHAGITGAAEASMAAAGWTYGRVQEQADIARRAALASALGESQAEAQRKLGIQNAAAGQAAGEEAHLRQQLAAQGGAVAHAEAGLAAPGLSGEQKEERRLHLAKEIAEQQSLQRQLVSAQQHSLEAQNAAVQTGKQYLEERVGLMRNEHQALTQIVQQERARKQALQESLGLARPTQQAAVLRIAKKIGAGGEGQLTFGELELIKQNREVFQQPLQRIGAQRGAGIMEELRRIPQLGLDAREKSAEKARAELKSQIDVQVKVDADSVAKALEQTLMPKIQQALALNAQAAKAALDRLMIEQRNAMRALQPGE